MNDAITNAAARCKAAGYTLVCGLGFYMLQRHGTSGQHGCYDTPAQAADAAENLRRKTTPTAQYVVRFEDGSYMGAIEGGGLHFVDTRAEAWPRPSQELAARDAVALQPFAGFTIERLLD